MFDTATKRRIDTARDSLVAVISLPVGCFQPYSGVKTSILILDKSLARQSDSIGFFKVENDGYGLSAQRRAVEGEQLTQVKTEISVLLQAIRSGVFRANGLVDLRANGPANIQLEPSVTLKTQDLDALGENFEKSTKGFIDFLLLNEKGFPLMVLEAKAEDESPLVGKEQARKYAKSKNCRFVILSNGNLHYFWDLERGNPYLITVFPSPTSVAGYQKSVPNPQRLTEEIVGDDYVVLTQRPYQVKAIVAMQQAVEQDSDRSLLEMATGTGKTLTATPFDYLKKFDQDKPTTKDPREFERRLMLDTYRTFGCEDGQPTFRYSLLDGVKDEFPINPTVVDDPKRLTSLYITSAFTIADLKAVLPEYRNVIPEYIKDYVSLNQFAA